MGGALSGEKTPWRSFLWILGASDDLIATEAGAGEAEAGPSCCAQAKEAPAGPRTRRGDRPSCHRNRGQLQFRVRFSLAGPAPAHSPRVLERAAMIRRRRRALSVSCNAALPRGCAQQLSNYRSSAGIGGGLRASEAARSDRNFHRTNPASTASPACLQVAPFCREGDFGSARRRGAAADAEARAVGSHAERKHQPSGHPPEAQGPLCPTVPCAAERSKPA